MPVSNRFAALPASSYAIQLLPANPFPPAPMPSNPLTPDPDAMGALRACMGGPSGRCARSNPTLGDPSTGMLHLLSPALHTPALHTPALHTPALLSLALHSPAPYHPTHPLHPTHIPPPTTPHHNTAKQLAAGIARNARAVACELLQRKNHLEYWRRLLLAYAPLMGYTITSDLLAERQDQLRDHARGACNHTCTVEPRPVWINDVQHTGLSSAQAEFSRTTTRRDMTQHHS